MPSFGDRLKMAREKKGWSQLFVAERTGISNTNISNYERDYREPDADTLKKLAELYEISLDWLLTGQLSVIEADESDMFTPAEKQLMDSLRNEPKYAEFLKTATEEEWTAFIDTIKKLVRGSIE